MATVLLLVVALLGGCSEYEVLAGNEPAGAPNPPGLASEVQVDRVVQTTVASVDVLWVIDTSCSMSQEQVQLAANFEEFMVWFLDSGLDYHIGVVTTNMDASAITMAGRLQAGGDAGQYLFIDTETPDPVAVFEDMAVLGTDSHYDERGRDAVFAALDEVTGHRDGFNAGFYREEASLAVVVISDEDDYSTMTVNEFGAWFRSLKPDPEMLSFSAIVGDEVGTWGTCATAAEPGRDYLALTREFNGVEWSICDDDWAPALDQLGMQASGLRREFYLTQLPVVESLRVWVEAEGEVVATLTQDVDYTYDRARNSVRLLDLVPESLQEVYLEYEVLATAQSTP